MNANGGFASNFEVFQWLETTNKYCPMVTKQSEDTHFGRSNYYSLLYTFFVTITIICNMTVFLRWSIESFISNPNDIIYAVIFTTAFCQKLGASLMVLYYYDHEFSYPWRWKRIDLTGHDYYSYNNAKNIVIINKTNKRLHRLLVCVYVLTFLQTLRQTFDLIVKVDSVWDYLLVYVDFYFVEVPSVIALFTSTIVFLQIRIRLNTLSAQMDVLIAAKKTPLRVHLSNNNNNNHDNNNDNATDDEDNYDIRYGDNHDDGKDDEKEMEEKQSQIDVATNDKHFNLRRVTSDSGKVQVQHIIHKKSGSNDSGSIANSNTSTIVIKTPYVRHIYTESAHAHKQGAYGYGISGSRPQSPSPLARSLSPKNNSYSYNKQHRNEIGLINIHINNNNKDVGSGNESNDINSDIDDNNRNVNVNNNTPVLAAVSRRGNRNNANTNTNTNTNTNINSLGNVYKSYMDTYKLYEKEYLNSWLRYFIVARLLSICLWYWVSITGYKRIQANAAINSFAFGNRVASISFWFLFNGISLAEFIIAADKNTKAFEVLKRKVFFLVDEIDLFGLSYPERENYYNLCNFMTNYTLSGIFVQGANVSIQGAVAYVFVFILGTLITYNIV